MDRRLTLDAELRELLGSSNVYFQPPESKKLVYDCFVYSDESPLVRNADNRSYLIQRGYEVIHIYKNPDGSMKERFLEHFKYASFSAHYVRDSLYHDVYRLFF